MIKSIPLKYREFLRRKIFIDAPPITPGADEENIAALKEHFSRRGFSGTDYDCYFSGTKGLSIRLYDGSDRFQVTWTRLLREMELWQRERHGEWRKVTSKLPAPLNDVVLHFDGWCMVGWRDYDGSWKVYNAHGFWDEIVIEQPNLWCPLPEIGGDQNG